MRRRAAGAAGALLLVAACSSGGGGPAQPTTQHQSITVTSMAFTDDGAIPVGFSCDGNGVSPPLTWNGVPGGAQSLALVVADPDAPGGTFYHWLVVDIPLSTHKVGTGQTPKGGVVAKNSAGDPAYMGPCPPSGTHHYHFTVYALSKPTGLPAGAGVSATIDAISTRALASGTLVGTYERP